MTEQVREKNTTKTDDAEEKKFARLNPEQKKEFVNKKVDDLTANEQRISTLKNRVKEKSQVPGDDDDDIKEIKNELMALLQKEIVEHLSYQEGLKVFLTELGKIKITKRESIYIASFIVDLLKKPDMFSFTPPNEDGETEFEQKLRKLYFDNEDAGEYVRTAIVGTAINNKLIINGTNYEKDYVDERIKKLRDEEREKKNEDYEKILNEQASKEVERQSKQQEKYQRRMTTERENLLSYFDDVPQNQEERRLINALHSSQEGFWDYIRGMMYGASGEQISEGMRGKARIEATKNWAKIEEQYKKEGKTVPNIDQYVNNRAQEMMSDELMNRIRRLIGKMYRQVDTKDFRTPWREAIKQGSFYKNIDSVTNEFYQRLTQMEEYTPPPDLQGITFFRTKQEEHAVEVEVKSRDEVDPTLTRLPTDKNLRAVKKELHTFIKPFFVSEKIRNFADYMKYVQNSVRTELSVRGFLHDARALPYLEVGQSSYWQQLANFARMHLNSADVDSMHTLFDGEDIMTASQTWDKINELSFARNNWIYKPLTGIPDPDAGITEIDMMAKEYILKLLKNNKIKKEEWEIDRILATGIGDNFGITLRALTTGSMSDPALKEDGSPSYQSYGTKDSQIFEAMNFIMHVMGRWDSESAKMAGLGWLPLEGEDLRTFSQTWDYRKLLDEMKKAQSAFVNGKSPDDVDKKVLRFFDILNIGKVGSIYDRSGWREFYAYEGWLVQDNPKQYNINKSFKAVEHIGIEAMKDFIGNIKSLDPDFFKDGAKNEGKRKELVGYLYKKYFINPDNPQPEQDIENAVNKLMVTLESEGPNLAKIKDGYAPKKDRSGNYDKFFHQVLSRAIAQRMPTKFIRMESERSRKVNALRDRAWERVYDLSLSQKIKFGEEEVEHNLSDRIKPDDEWKRQTNIDTRKESYYIALQDICAAGEVLLRRKATEDVKEGLQINKGAMHDIDLGDTYNLTPERMQELWEHYGIKLDADPTRDRERKLNALAVLKASRTFIYDEDVIVDSRTGKKEKYLDDFANKYREGHPFGPAFALATEELERSFLAHRAAGLNVPYRAAEDIVIIEQDVMKEIGAFYKDLVKVAADGKQSFDVIIDHIAKVRSPLSSMHSTEYANRVALWMSRIAIAFFKKNSDAENWTTAWKVAGEHHSLASYITNGLPGRVWEWDRATIRKFIDELAVKRLLPYEPYKATKHPAFEEVYKVNADGKFAKTMDGKLVASPIKRRKNDYEPFADSLVEQFLNNPVLELLSKVAPLVLVMIIAMFVSAAWKGYKGGTGGK